VRSSLFCLSLQKFVSGLVKGVQSVDVARTDTVDAELDRLISKRASQDRRPDPDEIEPSYVESVQRYSARLQEERRAARVEYHRGQAIRLRTVLEALIESHETQAAKLSEGGGGR
jgi:hypothetical protein